MEVMEDREWLGCPLIEVDPERVHGAPVFKGTRLPVDTITGNVDAFKELEGLTEDQAIRATLECFPSTPGGSDAIRAVLAYRETREQQLTH
jgi:uncharacterized protein (DUF433 family)